MKTGRRFLISTLIFFAIAGAGILHDMLQGGGL